jgi:hypothetical protein
MRAARLARSRATAVATAALAGACVALVGCTARLADLEGPRGVTQWITPPPQGADDAVDVPATFVLRNRSLGTVRIESLRVPIGTEVTTEPALPASIGGGRSIAVTVLARFRASEGDQVRSVKLETTGQPPLELMVDGRFQPAGPRDAGEPQAIGR